MFQIFSFILYWLKQEEEHSLHSPFVYDLYTNVIKPNSLQDHTIESLRQKLSTNKASITLQDFGAGSRVTGSNTRSISSIAKHASTPLKFSLLLQRIIAYFDFKMVIELGTSLGLNTLYLSQNPEVNVITFEGDNTLSDIAQTHFNSFKRTNIDIVTGNIDVTLKGTLAQVETIDLAYIDANHDYQPTVNYFNQLIQKIHSKSIIVIDDIHWSKGMWKAWQEVKSRPEVTLSIDLFEGGLLFFDHNLDGSAYTLKF